MESADVNATGSLKISAYAEESEEDTASTLMLYVLLSFFSSLVLIGISGLFLYIGQRFCRAHAKRKHSHRLREATRKVLKTLTLHTLSSTDQEVISGCDQCAVCIELFKVSDVVRVLPCRHTFHKKCIDPWLLDRHSCPLCKSDILIACGFLIDRSFRSVNTTDCTSSTSSITVIPFHRSRRHTSCIARLLALILGYPRVDHFGCPYSSVSHIHLSRLSTINSPHHRCVHLLQDASDVISNSKPCSSSVCHHDLKGNVPSLANWFCCCFFGQPRRPYNIGECSAYQNIVTPNDRLCDFHASVLGVPVHPSCYQPPDDPHHSANLLNRHLINIESLNLPASSAGSYHSRLYPSFHVFLTRLKDFFSGVLGDGKLPDSEKSPNTPRFATQSAPYPLNEKHLPVLPGRRVSLTGTVTRHCEVLVHNTDEGYPLLAEVPASDQQKSRGNNEHLPALITVSQQQSANIESSPVVNSEERLSPLPPVATLTDSDCPSDGSSEPSLVVLLPPKLYQPFSTPEGMHLTPVEHDQKRHSCDIGRVDPSAKTRTEEAQVGLSNGEHESDQMNMIMGCKQSRSPPPGLSPDYPFNCIDQAPPPAYFDITSDETPAAGDHLRAGYRRTISAYSQFCPMCRAERNPLPSAPKERGNNLRLSQIRSPLECRNQPGIPSGSSRYQVRSFIVHYQSPNSTRDASLSDESKPPANSYFRGVRVVVEPPDVQCHRGSSACGSHASSAELSDTATCRDESAELQYNGNRSA